jgi:hypothetical protein
MRPTTPDPRHTPPTDGALFWGPPAWLFALLVSLRVVFVAARIGQTPPLDDTLLRFVDIARAVGRPYVDYQVEYAPLDFALIRLLAMDGLGSAWVRVEVFAFACDIGTALVLFRAWGRAAATRYLLLGLPLVWLLYARIDLFSVFLATAGLAAVRGGRERTGGVFLGLAVLAKLWPLALLVPLAAKGSRRAVKWTATVVVVSVGVWILSTSLTGPSDVVTYRGASGWSVESTVGAAIWASTGGPISLEEGSWRVGVVTAAARLALFALLSIFLLAIARRARNSTSDPAGAASVATVAALTALSPLFSLQYTSWLLPWGAITARREARVLVPVLVSVFATAIIGFLLVRGAPPRAFAILLLIRGLATIGCVIAYLMFPMTGPRPTPS